MSFSSNIKFLRESHGMTQSQIGAIAGVTDKAVSTWESGTKEPRMGCVEHLSNYFHISKSSLLFDDLAHEKTAAQAGDGLSAEAREIMELFDSAPPALRAAALAVLKSGEAVDKTPGDD